MECGSAVRRSWPEACIADEAVAGEGEVDADGLMSSFDCIETGCAVLTGDLVHAILFVYPSQTKPPRLQFVPKA